MRGEISIMFGGEENLTFLDFTTFGTIFRGLLGVFNMALNVLDFIFPLSLSLFDVSATDSVNFVFCRYLFESKGFVAFSVCSVGVTCSSKWLEGKLMPLSFAFSLAPNFFGFRGRTVWIFLQLGAITKEPLRPTPLAWTRRPECSASRMADLTACRDNCCWKYFSIFCLETPFLHSFSSNLTALMIFRTNPSFTRCVLVEDILGLLGRRLPLGSTGGYSLVRHNDVIT